MSFIAFFKPNKGIIQWSNIGQLNKYLLDNDLKNMYADIDMVKGKRSLDQNNALHKYFELLAQALNDAGFTFKYIMGEKTLELDWNAMLIKETVWRPIQIALTGKRSSADLDRVSEINLVYEHLNRFFSNKPFCIHVPFPNDEKKNQPSKIDYPTRDESNTPNI